MTVDAKATVLGFDAIWNAHDRAGLVAMIDDDSTVDFHPAPPPPGRARYEGRAGVTEFVDQFLPGFHVDSQNFRTENAEIVWEFAVSNDLSRAMGADPLIGTARLTLGDSGRLRSFRVALDDATIARLATAQAA